MNITQRYVCAYIFECLTGFHGENPNYSTIVKNIRIKLGNPVLDRVVEIVRSSGRDPRDVRVVKQVKDYVKEQLNKQENKAGKNARQTNA